MNEEKDETVFQPSAAPSASPSAVPLPPEVPATGGALAAPPNDEEEGTVFIAPSAPPAPASPAPASAPPIAPLSDEEEGTVFAAAPNAPPASSIPPAPPAPPPPAAPRRTGGAEATLQPGTRLNRLEIKRFLARGGMGEVFEAVHIDSGERVAIKTILPDLAADPNVIAMFQREAQALTQLSHPAVVQYRDFVLEPERNLYYIVTRFIDGRNLSDLVGKTTPTEEELISLLRRLAEGLREAHELGAVHRDISPDNVLLDHDRMDRPKIIDFGIVKETDPGSKTIIGNGFAGKPSYVAPEQMGDFDQQIGPWTDVYSLALVILALAQGRKPDLGGLPAEAIMKRRKGVDTSAVPPQLRAVIDRMLVADPQKRLRSMDEVIRALDAIKRRKGAGGLAGGKGAAGLMALPKPVLAGIGGAAALVVVGAGWYALRPASPAAQAPAVAAPPNVSLASLDAAVQGVLPQLSCSWMTVETARDGAGYTMRAVGVAGSPLEAENGLLKAAQKLGVEPGTDFSGVVRIDPSYCPVLDELAKFRAPPPERMTRKQPEYELETMAQGEYAGQIGTRVVTDLALDGISSDYALYSIETSNVITQFVPNRSFLPANVNGSTIQKLPGIDNYRLDIETNAKPGWAGIVLLTGKGGFTATALSDLTTAAGKAAFEQKARANDWKAQIIWYKFVDNIPNTPAAKP